MGDWSPLEKQEMRTVITVRGAIEAVNLVRVRVIAVRGWCYVDPLLLPLPHRPIEHRGWSVPGRGSTRSGPNSLHGSPIPLRWRFAGRPIRGKIKKKNFALIFGSLALCLFGFSLSLSLSQRRVRLWFACFGRIGCFYSYDTKSRPSACIRFISNCWIWEVFILLETNFIKSNQW